MAIMYAQNLYDDQSPIQIRRAGSPSVRILIFTCLNSDIRFFLTRLLIIRAHMPGSPYINIEHKSHPVSRLRIYISPQTIRYGDQVSTFGNLQDLQFLFLKNLKAPLSELPLNSMLNSTNDVDATFRDLDCL